MIARGGRRRLGRRSAAVATLLVALVALVALAAGPAAAHPWGTPPVATVEADGQTVTVHWRAEPDDSLLLGVELGVLDPLDLDWDWDGPQGPPGTTGALLPPSAALEAYLLERIRVVQAGVACAGEVDAFGDFVADGATTRHRCPEPVTVVELEISMLHNVHEAYRTFAESSGQALPRQAVYTVGTPVHEWTFGEAATSEQSRAWVEIAALAVLAVAVAGLAAHRRRRRGRTGGTGGRLARLGVRRRSKELERAGTLGAVPVVLLAATEQQPFGWLEAELLRLIDMQNVGATFGIVAVAIAFGIGGAHAMAPGHGKALIGAYLVGTRGRPSDAVALGGVVAAMHCASVLVFGGLLMATLSMYGTVGDVLPWMSVAAGALVTAVGMGLVVRQVRLRAARRTLVPAHAHAGAAHGHGHDPHTHDHGHDAHAHGHYEHGHSHDLPEGVAPLSRRGVVALGASGGLLPSPSAFLVLATAILTGRALFGLALVAAFSLGLATTLTVFGLATIKGRALVERRALASPRIARLTSRLPLVSSVAVLAGGLWIMAAALWSL